MKKSFIIHVDSLGILDELTDEQAGQLFKLIAEYHNPSKPKLTQITQLVNLAFFPFKSQFERDLQTYSKVVERNKNNGLKGGRPKKENPKKPKKADSDSVNDNESDNDNEITFSKFWDLYDKKRSKPKAEKKWVSISLHEKQKIMAHVPKYVASTPDKKYRKDACTYLNNESWKDEIIGLETIPTAPQNKFVSVLKEEDKEW